MKSRDRTFEHFWSDATAIRGSITPRVVPIVLSFGMLALLVCALAWAIEALSGHRIGLSVAFHEIAGAILGLMLVLRTNAGYDRWWEGRRLWGGIVNQSRNLAIAAISYGPENSDWRERVLAWSRAFPRLALTSLRGEPPDSGVAERLGLDAAARLADADHAPSHASARLAALLREARDAGTLDGFAFLQIDAQRALLIDHLGGCERILKTPLPRAYAINIRRFLLLFLASLPFALLHKMESDWGIPLITMLVAYPLLALDQTGVELQNPFSTRNLSHLPLDGVVATIDRNLAGLHPGEHGSIAKAAPSDSSSGSGGPLGLDGHSQVVLSG